MNLCDLLNKEDFVDMIKSLRESPEFDVVEEKKLKERFPMRKCYHCGKPYRDMGEIKCPYCKGRV